MPSNKGFSTETTPLLPSISNPALAQPEGESQPEHSSSDGAPLEQQESATGRSKQYEGLPDVRKRMKYMFPALAIGVFLMAADGTVIVTSYEKIGSELGALDRTSWITTAYFLTLTAFQPLYGKLSDIFSRKSCLLVAYAIFGLGALGCGLAQTMNQLIIARAVAGIGGGGMSTIVSILLSDVIPLKDRGAWQGYINIIYSAGATSGATLGGVFADSLLGWRSSFLCQPPLCLAALLAVAFTLKMPPKEDEGNWKQKLHRVDFLGAAVIVCAVFCLMFGLDRGSNIAWQDKWTLIPLCSAFPLFGLFLFVELRIAAEPFAPGRIIFERTLFAAYLCNFFSFAGWLATQFYASLYFQAVLGKTATQAGILLIPNLMSGVLGSLFAGFYMRRTGKYYWLTIIAYSFLFFGLLWVLLFSGLLVHFLPGFIASMVICGFSQGISVTSSLIALISNANREDQAIATACSYLFRSLGSGTGVSLAAAVANQTLRWQLKQQLGDGEAAEKIAEGVRRRLSYIHSLPPRVQEVVKFCYARSTQAAFGLQVALVAGAAISAWLIREKPLSR